MRNLKTTTITLLVMLAVSTAIAKVPLPKPPPPLVGDARLAYVDRLPQLNRYVFTYILSDGGCMRVMVNPDGSLASEMSAVSC